MDILKSIKFLKVKSTNSAEDKLEFLGELTLQGLNSYVTYTEIKNAVIKEIINRLEENIALKVEALKPDIAEEIIKKNNLK